MFEVGKASNKVERWATLCNKCKLYLFWNYWDDLHEIVISISIMSFSVVVSRYVFEKYMK